MGLTASSDEWCRQSDRIVEGLRWAKKIVDDTLIWAPTHEELIKRIEIVLERCDNIGVTISIKKFEIGQDILFAGYRVTKDGIRPDPEKTLAIRKFPEPKEVTGIRSFLGLANQLTFFVPDFAHMSAKMR